MLKHVHADAAFEYVMSDNDPSSFPFHFVSALVKALTDPEREVAAIRRAIEGWRVQPAQDFISSVPTSLAVVAHARSARLPAKS
jgi:hypothetical protein